MADKNQNIGCLWGGGEVRGGQLSGRGPEGIVWSFDSFVIP